MDATEIEIPVPWGVIAAKTWGSSSDPVILMLHGLEDNANTFDHLVCKLPYIYYYVSIDLPGHGKSDNLPSIGLPLQGMDYVYVIKLIVDHFQRDKYIIIGHSFGAILGMQFGLVYPEKLDKVFILDTIWFEVVPANEFGKWTRNKFEEFTRLSLQMNRFPNAVFSYDECLDLMANFRYGNCELVPSAVETLVKRSIKMTHNGKYRFTRDHKLKNYMCYPMSEALACDILNSHNISFKVVVIMTNQYEIFYNSTVPTLVQTYKKIGDWINVQGNHNVHLNDPNKIANIINRYIDEDIS